MAGSTQTTDWTVVDGAIVGQDDLKIALSITNLGDKAAVGTYHITGEADNSNYDVTFADEDSQNNYGVYTVTARPISVQIGDASGIYGDAPVLTTGSSGVTLTDVTTEAENAGLVRALYDVDGVFGCFMRQEKDDRRQEYRKQNEIKNKIKNKIKGRKGLAVLFAL